jgi:hypothetical protein
VAHSPQSLAVGKKDCALSASNDRLSQRMLRACYTGS